MLPLVVPGIGVVLVPGVPAFGLAFPFTLTFSFAFALAAATLWEIFEFTMDNTFGFTMQKSGLDDTTADLIVSGAGAVFAVGTGYLFLVRRHAPLGWFEYMLERYFDENPDDSEPK